MGSVAPQHVESSWVREPMFPVLSGRFLTTLSPGKSSYGLWIVNNCTSIWAPWIICQAFKDISRTALSTGNPVAETVLAMQEAQVWPSVRELNSACRNSCMPQQKSKILCATTEAWQSQINILILSFFKKEYFMVLCNQQSAHEHSLVKVACCSQQCLLSGERGTPLLTSKNCTLV